MTAAASKQVPKLRFPKFEGDWRRKPLKALSSKSISYGIVQTGTSVENGVKCVRVVDLTKPQIDFEDLITTSEKISQSYKKTILIEGEIMIALRGNIGLVASVPKELEGSNLTRGIARISPMGSEVHSSYLLWALRSPEGRIEFLKQVNGSALKEIPIGGLNKIKVAFPTLPEQRKIADFLSSVDKRIEQLTQKKSLLEQYKKGVMQQLFTQKIRFKDDDGKDFPGWEEKKLGEVVDSSKKWSFTGGPFGSNLKSEDYTDEGVRIIQLQNIGDGEFLNSYKIYTSEVKANELLSCNIYPGDLILSKMGDPVARACIIPNHEERYVMCSDGIRLAIDESRFDRYFVFCQINHRTFRNRAITVGTGSTRKRIGLTELRELPLLAPSIKEQTKIGSFLAAIDRKIESVTTQITETQTFKKGLLQQMFV